MPETKHLSTDDRVNSDENEKGATLPNAAQESESAAASDAPPPEKGRVRPLGVPLSLFFHAVEQAPIAISITDLKANILYANPAFTDTTGYSPDEARGKNESILSDESTPERLYAELWEELANQRTFSGHLVNRRKDGSRYLAEISASAVLGEDGATSAYLGIHRDVTEKHRLTREVSNQRALISSLLDSAPTLIAALDENGGIAFANAAYDRMAAQFGGEGRLAESLRNALCGDDVVCLHPQGENMEVPPREVELEFPGDPEPWFFSCSARWLREDDGSADAFFRTDGKLFFLLFANNITSLRRQQEEVRTNALRALVSEEERLQSLKETLSAAVFQFQMPMNLLESAVALVQHNTDQDDESEQLVSALREVLDRGNEVIDLLGQSDPEPDGEAVTSVDVNQIVRDVIRLNSARLLSEDVLVDWKPTRLPAFHGREGRIRAMLKQLLDNAIEALSPTGPREISIEARTEDHQLVLAVSDTGPGIPEHLRLKVFEPFFTLGKPKRAGAGLGLSLIQDIVSEHSGTIYVDPRLESGCRMVIELPLKKSVGE